MVAYKFTLTVIALALSAFLVIKPALAAVRCETQYGGGEVCVKTGELQINKMVWDPIQKKFVDNLGLNDHRFAPGEEVTFKLQIKNVGDATFAKVNVADTLPSMLTLAGGSLNFDISDLTVGKTEEREIKAKVVEDKQFPTNKNLICVVNAAEVSGDNQKDKDTAQLCLERKAAPVPAKKLPPTGNQSWIFVIASATVSLLTSFYLLKFKRA
ncbi:hypothetical protein HY404_00500 [Candidatus Microgenomates bacterium]|nr:hypothetical protein [Candidatus Microgenomates bacterium]